VPAGYRMEIVRDQSVFIEAATHAVQEHLVIGSLLAALVVLLFLGNGRSTLIAAVAIPTSVIATFALMSTMGFTLNVITLLALTLAVGIVIDDAIVVLENVFRAAYTWLLGQAMRRRWAVVMLCAVALGSIVPISKAVPKNFLPEDDESQFEITVRAPEGTNLGATERIANALAARTRELRGVRYTMVTVADDAQTTTNLATIYVRLKETHERKRSQAQLVGEVRERVLPQFAGQNLRLSVQPIVAIGSGKDAAVQYTLAGPDFAQLAAYSEKALAKLKTIPGVVDPDTSLVMGGGAGGALRVDRPCPGRRSGRGAVRPCDHPATARRRRSGLDLRGGRGAV
jgi:multidrug efflux pump subunit AcrB